MITQEETLKPDSEHFQMRKMANAHLAYKLKTFPHSFSK